MSSGIDEHSISIPTPKYFVKITNPEGDDLIYASELIARLGENLRPEDIERDNMTLVRWEEVDAK